MPSTPDVAAAVCTQQCDHGPSEPIEAAVLAQDDVHASDIMGSSRKVHSQPGIDLLLGVEEVLPAGHYDAVNGIPRVVVVALEEEHARAIGACRTYVGMVMDFLPTPVYN